MSYQNDRIKGIPAPLPKDYDRQANFTNWEVQNPGEPPRGTDLDAEFNTVEQALDETQARLRIIQRDDGAVANNSIGFDQLTNEARIGVEAPVAWEPFTRFGVNNSVIVDEGAWYIARDSHVSAATFQEDLDAGKWVLLIDLTPYTTEAKNWATLPEDQPVPEGDGTEYSAKHHAAKALASEIAAQLAQQNAEDAETEAKSARDTAVSAASNAQDAEEGAEAARDEARDFVTSTEYEFAGDYTAGLTLTAYNQLVRDTSGEFWRVSGSEPLPYTLTGAGVPEGGALVSVGDAALRQELADPAQGGGLVGITTATGEQTIGQWVAYLHQVGMPEWNGGQEFHNGSVTNRNGAIYVCLTDNHVSATPPEDDSSNWFNATQVGQNIEVFDTAGVTEWPVPAPLQAGLRKARVTLAGAGGAGGAGESGVRIGNEGASGGAAIKLCDLTGMSTVTLTVGEGGGPVTDETGEAGTSTSFGSIFSAEGGEGGKQTSAVVAVPGDGIGGDLNITGNAGSEGAQTGDIRLVPRAGQPSPLGGGRAAGYRSASGVGSYINGQFAGASGAGGITSNTGGAGADGIIIIEW